MCALIEECNLGGDVVCLDPGPTPHLVLCRDHRMSLAEEVPYLRWRTTQLAQFELTYAVKDIMSKVKDVV